MNIHIHTPLLRRPCRYWLVILSLAFLPLTLAAQTGNISASEIYRDSQVTDLAATRRLVAGGNEVLRWTFILLKIIAVAAVGWGVIQAFAGEIPRMMVSFLVALVLFFVPQIIDLAEGLARWANTL